MAELNLNQIAERLNSEFSGEARTLVFWYDDNGEFAEDIDSLEPVGAKVYKLEPDNQFYTKYFLERVDTGTNYLIYAPFPKPNAEENHLEDTLLYSKRFYADRASLLCVDLGIREGYKPLIQRHISFFNEQQRRGRFYDLEIEEYNEETILIGMMSAICRTKNCSFEEVVRVVLTDGELSENPFLAEMNRFGLLPPFWEQCARQFGYSDSNPTLERFTAMLFVTYAARQLHCSVPAPWKSFLSPKSGSVIAFLDNLMNSILYRERFDELSAYVSEGLHVPAVMEELDPKEIADCDVFAIVDRILIRWMTDRLASEDTGAQLNGQSIPNICEKRLKCHFGEINQTAYSLLRAAYPLVTAAHYTCPDGLKAIADQYRTRDCLLDQAYRQFYFYYDKLDNSEPYEPLRTLAENIYANEYLSVLLPKWNQAIQADDAFTVLPPQMRFYRAYLQYAIKRPTERIAVIISDAMRYEVGQELFQRLSDDPRCKVKLDVQLSVLPSITRMGMAALLPHESVTLTDDYKVLADGVLCDDLPGREKVLRKYVPKSRCVQYDEIKNLNSMDFRSLIAGNNIVYIYHNQIDARGDKASTENEVFTACTEAVQEIIDLIHALASRTNTQRCIVTADHGFLYRRDKLTESDKIDGISGGQSGAGDGGAFLNRRFVVSKKAVSGEGIASLPMSRILNSSDEKTVSFPVGSQVFKLPGGGQNFVHGGSSPQEMLVPVLDVKTEKASVATTRAKLILVNVTRKITNLIVNLDFIQEYPISDTIRAEKYRIYFMSESNERISNEVVHIADSRAKEANAFHV